MGDHLTRDLEKYMTVDASVIRQWYVGVDVFHEIIPLKFHKCSVEEFNTFHPELFDHLDPKFAEDFNCLDQKLVLWEANMYDYQSFYISLNKCEGEHCFDEET